MYVSINGKLLPKSEPAVRADDIGLLRGYGVFQVVRVYKSKQLFLFEEHFQSLKKDADRIGIDFSLKKEEVRRQIFKLLEKNDLEEGYVRMVLTGGKAKRDIEPTSSNFLLLAGKAHLPEKEKYEEGVLLKRLEHLRAVPEAKTTNYVVPISRKEQLGEAFCFLYTKEGKVLEATTSNFFLVKSDKLITSGKNVLPGTTRKKVLQLARERLPIKVEEREVEVEELEKAKEAFLVSTIKEILPVRKVDEFKFEAPGEVTTEIKKEFEKIKP